MLMKLIEWDSNLRYKLVFLGILLSHCLERKKWNLPFEGLSND
jgi:hypothetical protein